MAHARLLRNWAAMRVGLCGGFGYSRHQILSLAQMQSGWTNRLVWLKGTCLDSIRVRITQGCYSGSPSAFSQDTLAPGLTWHQQRQWLKSEQIVGLCSPGVGGGILYGRALRGVHGSFPSLSPKHFPPAGNITMSDDLAPI